MRGAYPSRASALRPESGRARGIGGGLADTVFGILSGMGFGGRAVALVKKSKLFTVARVLPAIAALGAIDTNATHAALRLIFMVSSVVSEPRQDLDRGAV